jgi:hypothetical protein
MKQRHFMKSLTPPISSTLVAFFLVIMLTACNTAVVTLSSPSGTPSGKTAKTPTKSPTSVPSKANISLQLNASNITENNGNLRIQSNYGFQCPSNPTGTGFGMDRLVLASDRTTYSQAEIAQIRAYVNNNLGTGPEKFLTTGAEPPPTLRWVPGGSVDSIPGAVHDVPCLAVLALTNTGNTPIQLPTVGVQLKALPQQNTYHYRLINACSLLPPTFIGCPPTQGGGPGNCSFYFATIQLGPGEQNNVFSAVPGGSTGCGTLTISPANQVLLYITFSLAPNTPKNLIYSVLPIFTVDTTQGTQTISLPQLASTLTFASADQFSCYKLQGTTFTPVPSPTDWCM